MKATRFIALLLATFFFTLTPAMANSYNPGAGGVSNGGAEPAGNGCFATTFTVRDDPNSNVRLVVRNDDNEVVYDRTKRTNANGVAKFRVRQCEPGTYTATAFDAQGNVIGTSQFVVPARGDNDAGNNAGNGSGSLPSTGSDSQDMLALGGGLALLAVGGATLVAARRRSKA